MPTASQIDTVEDALLALIDARPGLDGVAVGLGEPSGKLERDHVWLDTNVEEDQVWEVTKTTDVSSGVKREVFTLRATAFALKLGDTWKATRDRVKTLADEITGAVLASPTVSGTAWHAEVVAKDRVGGMLGDKGIGAMVTVEIEVWAFLS